MIHKFIEDLDIIKGSPNTQSDDLYALMIVLNTYNPYAVQINTYERSLRPSSRPLPEKRNN